MINYIIFEREYLYGNYNGKAKKYYNNGILEFEGKYSIGRKNVKGKEYYDNDIMVY